MNSASEPVFVNLLRNPKIDSQPTGPPATQGSGIDASESIPVLHNRFQIRALVYWHEGNIKEENNGYVVFK
jgi:hypothetical protein